MVHHGPGSGMVVYINGELKKEAKWRKSYRSRTMSGRGQLGIGRFVRGKSRYADVIVDELKFYNKPLTPDQILLDYNSSNQSI